MIKLKKALVLLSKLEEESKQFAEEDFKNREYSIPDLSSDSDEQPSLEKETVFHQDSKPNLKTHVEKLANNNYSSKGVERCCTVLYYKKYGFLEEEGGI